MLGMWTRATGGRMADIEKKTKRYPSDLTDEEWSRIQPFLPGAAKTWSARGDGPARGLERDPLYGPIGWRLAKRRIMVFGGRLFSRAPASRWTVRSCILSGTNHRITEFPSVET